MKKLILLALSSLFFVSCSTTTTKSVTSGQINIEISSKMMADIEVDMTKKIVGSATLKKILIFTTTEPTNFADGVNYYPQSGSHSSGGILSFFMGGSPVESVKAAAAYNALSSAKAEYIVAPQYIVKDNSNFFTKEISVQVTGYAGKLKSIRPIDHKSVGSNVQ